MAYSRIHLIFLESRLLRGREGSSLLMHAPSTLLLSHSCFSLFSTCLSLLFFPYCYYRSLCTAKTFSYCLPLWVLLFYPSTTFALLSISFPDHPLVCWLFSHYHYPVLAMPRSIPRQKSFVLFSYSLWHSHPDKGWVFFLTNSYGMHLVIPTHLSLFWVVFHSSKNFPPREVERESHNRLLPFPHRQTIPFLISDQ